MMVSYVMVARLIPSPREALPAVARRTLDFDTIYDRYFAEVMRWARALGGPPSDLEDIAQEVFIVTQRRLPQFDGRNLGGWLYRITANTVSDHRRRAWFKNLFSRRNDENLEEIRDGGYGPSETAERNQAHRLIQKILDRMTLKRRAAFVMFEIEGYSGEEIAQLEGVPLATVFTRLHHARKEFFALLEKCDASGGKR